MKFEPILVESDRQWMIPVAVFVGLQQIASLTIALYLNYSGMPPFWNYGLACLVAAEILIAVVITRAVVATFKAKPDSPLRHLASLLSERRALIQSFVVGLGLAWLQLVSLTWTKALIPIAGPYWADPLLADLDKAVFGVDPWRLVQPILHPIEPVIDSLYALWPLFLKLTLLAVLLVPASRNKSIAILAFFITIGLGIFSQFLLPSGGPIFWERLGLGDRFNELVPAGHAAMISDYLWGKHLNESADFASGISAFPSMHVALAAWMVLAAYLVFPKVRGLMWFYFGVVFVGSVSLGWHYVSDGIAGSLGVLIAWKLAILVTTERAYLGLRVARLAAAPASSSSPIA